MDCTGGIYGERGIWCPEAAPDAVGVKLKGFCLFNISWSGKIYVILLVFHRRFMQTEGGS